jgi:DNA-binding transcriptional regulator YiaG
MGYPREFELAFHPQKGRRRIIEKHVEDVIRSERGEQIYQLRKYMGLSRDRLAELMNVHVDSVVSWEFAKHEPNRLAWNSFLAVRRKLQRQMKKIGKELDGGPLMGDNW